MRKRSRESDEAELACAAGERDLNPELATGASVGLLTALAAGAVRTLKLVAAAAVRPIKRRRALNEARAREAEATAAATAAEVKRLSELVAWLEGELAAEKKTTEAAKLELGGAMTKRRFEEERAARESAERLASLEEELTARAAEAAAAQGEAARSAAEVESLTKRVTRLEAEKAAAEAAAQRTREEARAAAERVRTLLSELVERVCTPLKRPDAAQARAAAS